MLQTIREHTHGWIAGAIISLVILSFALWGIHSYFEGGGNNNIVATVNGAEVSKEQFTVAYERLRRQAQVQYGANSNKDDSILKKRALQALIDIQVLKQASLNQGFYISSGQVDNYLQSMPEFQVDGQFSLDRFQEILSSTMMSTSDFLELINTSLLIDQPRLGIVLTSFALPDETDYTISLVNQERNIAYISVPAQYFLKKPINISPETIKSYYDSHQAEFMTPEQVNVEYVQLSLADLSKNYAPTDAALKAFYNENINSYTQPTSWRFSDILIPVSENATADEIKEAYNKAEIVSHNAKAGQDFSLLGIGYSSEGINNRGLMILNQVPAELQKSVAGLTAKDQISDPIKTSKGYVILKVVDYKEPKIQSFDEVKDKVKETLVRQQSEELFSEMRDRLADVTYEHPESLQVAAKTLNLPIATTELFSKDKAGKDISQHKKVRDVAFSNDVLNLQNNSDVVQLNPETVIVLRVKSHITSSLLPLASITKQIEDKLKAKESETRAAKFAQDFLQKLQSGADASKIAHENQLEWHQAGLIGRYAKNVEPAILEEAFSLPDPALAGTTVSYGTTRLPNGYAIVLLKAVKRGSVVDEKQHSVFSEQVQSSEGVLEYGLYKQSQIKKAKINIL